MDLPNKHRPDQLSKLVGQDTAVKVIEGWKKVPQAILLTGPSGCGKTTTARIIKKLVNCGDSDFSEVNCADFNGIQMIRDIRTRYKQSPMDGDMRIWLIDEAQQLTKDAQNAFLKMLEEPPKKVMFILGTTDPQKLLTTIKTRCREIKFSLLNAEDMKTLIKRTTKKEKIELSKNVIGRIVEGAEGSPRKALVLIESVMGLKKEANQLDAIAKSDSRTMSYMIGRMLLDTRTRWPDICPKLKELEDEPETIRRIILAYMSTVALSGSNMSHRAVYIINIFRDHWYDCGKSGLIQSCYQVITAKK